MTDQEAFDKMMNHLRSLSGQSVDSNGDCAYNGSKCAIGVLMTDEEQQGLWRFLRRCYCPSGGNIGFR